MEGYSKYELLELNRRVWEGKQDLFPLATSLDSSMKKNTAFIKRIRAGITAPALPTLLQDIRTLSLHKYLSELITACYEGVCKLKTTTDINAGVRVVSALHQRFGVEEFTKYLAWYISRGLSVPNRTTLKAVAQDVREKDEKERVSRQRFLLRVATDLWMVGIIRTGDDVGRPEDIAKDSIVPENVKPKSTSPPSKPGNMDLEPIPLRALNDMIYNDRDHTHLPLVVTFAKAFDKELLEAETTPLILSQDEDNSISETPPAETSSPPPEPLLVSPEIRHKFKQTLVRYFEILRDHLIQDKEALDTQARRNAEAYVKSGEVFEDRQSHYERQAKALEKLTSSVQTLADILGCEMPDLRAKESAAPAEGIIGMLKSSDYAQMQSAAAGIWEDEDEKRFYENLVDLKDRVPATLLEIKKKKSSGTDVKLKRTDSKTNTAALVDMASPAVPNGNGRIDSPDPDDLSAVLVNKTVVAQLDAILARLPDVSHKEMIDEIAHEFCYVNSKASRNRLMKVLQDIPKGRTDLLPLYSRLIATLNKYMLDISQGMVEYLDDEFRSLQRRKQREFLGQVRLVNVRYLAEMTKFGVVPEHVIFHCLKVTIDDFSRMNIEIMCTLLECCGRYLFKTAETHERMATVIETVQRKKSVQNLGQQERVLIENACYFVNPPERPAVAVKERTPIELFVRKLMYTELRRSSLEKIVKLLKKLHWDKPETMKLMHKVFSKPQKMTYSNINLLAAMLEYISRYHSEFSVSVIDSLLESITLGLELNDYQFNQNRLSQIKYLGELYVYKLVDSPVIFTTIYHIVTYGHEGGTPTPGRLCGIDLPDDYFRIRLVCSLLETCGALFIKGQARKKLDFFLAFFQYYMYTKDPLPMDIEFVVLDMYSKVRPRWKLATTLTEAASLFAEAVKTNYKTTGREAETLAGGSREPEEAEEEDEGSRTDHEDEEDDHDLENEDEQWFNKELHNGDGAEVDEDHEDSLDDDESDAGSRDSQFALIQDRYERDTELEADFDREYAKMMAESLDSRKTERKPAFNAPLPVRIAPTVNPNTNGGGPMTDITDPNDLALNGIPAPIQSPNPPGIMKFAVLTKRGNKPQTRTIDLPSESSFAQAISSSKQAEEEERQRIKQLVLTYNQSSTTESEFDPVPYSQSSQPRLDKASKSRSGQRSRKLQLDDVMW